MGHPPADMRWVMVADREADSYEHLPQCHNKGLGFVVRAAQDRALVAGPAKAPAGRLFRLTRAQPSAGTFPLILRGRPRQPAREVVLHVSFSPPLALRAPQRPSGVTCAGAPVPNGLVRVWEDIGPDATGAGLEWLLLCDQPVTDFAQALICARQYTSRWLIENFHRALKTGLGAGKLQLQTTNRLFAALALVDLREKSRLQPDLPAEAAGLTATKLRVLRHQCRRPLATVREVYLALAALGGHLGRKGGGAPDWQTRWLGRMSLRLLVKGVNMAAQLLDK